MGAFSMNPQAGFWQEHLPCAQLLLPAHDLVINGGQNLL